ncbi:MAG: cyclic nucleotide-binding domain-containing protein [Deltaproteobacteria bacterium]|nr:cyclic nucleotide-binding domain-containing protein [Deltaproteobacteria bacterium]
MELEQEYIDLFREIFPLETLDDDYIEAICQKCRTQRYEAGKIIFEEGQEGETFFIILEGAVEVWRDYGSPDRELLNVCRRGNTFGELALVDDLPRSATVVAREAVTLLSMSRTDFISILKEHSSAALSIMRSVSAIVRRSNHVFINHLREKNRQLEKAYQDLREAQEELLRAERLSNLGKFSSLILHDFRNPLTSVRGYAGLILAYPDDKEEITGSAKMIISEADRLNRLADDLLDYSRGVVRVNLAPVMFAEFLTTWSDSLAAGFKERGISIVLEVRVTEPVIMDEYRMHRMFTNLATNAYKAMPQGGRFSIKAWEDDGAVICEVADTGVGMNAEVLDKLFEPFCSFSDEGGTGLGMPIVKSILEAHHGFITVYSREGEGTRFSITIPKTW